MTARACEIFMVEMLLSSDWFAGVFGGVACDFLFSFAKQRRMNCETSSEVSHGSVWFGCPVLVSPHSPHSPHSLCVSGSTTAETDSVEMVVGVNPLQAKAKCHRRKTSRCILSLCDLGFARLARIPPACALSKCKMHSDATCVINN